MKVLLPCLTLIATSLLISSAQAEVESTSVTPNPGNAEGLWFLGAGVTTPLRGFELRTTDPTAPDSKRALSYRPSPSLEGSAQIGYRGLNFQYEHTLASGSLDSSQGAPSSVTEQLHLSFLLGNTLLEFSHHSTVGMAADLGGDAPGSHTLVRPDLKMTDSHLRGLYGFPLFGSDTANSLANFYTTAQPPSGLLSVDLLASLELNQESLEGSSPFLPADRTVGFGEEGTLSRLTSNGGGAGIGAGLTVPMASRSFFSMAALLGRNYNQGQARYANSSEDISGWSSFINARMAVRWMWGPNDLGVRLAVDDWTLPAHDNNLSVLDASMGLNYGRAF